MIVPVLVIMFAMVTNGCAVGKFRLSHVLVLKRLQCGLIPDTNVDHHMAFEVPVSCIACGVGILQTN